MKTGIWVLVIIVLVIAAILLFSGRQAGLPGGQEEEAGGAATEPRSVLVQLLPRGAAATAQTGTVRFTEILPTQLRVIANIENPKAGVAQAIHIHEGQCDNLGRIVLPLQSLVDGNSVSTVDSNFYNLFNLGINYSVAVHQSVENLANVTACGNILPS